MNSLELGITRPAVLTCARRKPGVRVSLVLLWLSSCLPEKLWGCLAAAAGGISGRPPRVGPSKQAASRSHRATREDRRCLLRAAAPSTGPDGALVTLAWQSDPEPVAAVFLSCQPARRAAGGARRRREGAGPGEPWAGVQRPLLPDAAQRPPSSRAPAAPSPFVTVARI